MKTITKKELVHRIAEKTQVTKVVAKEVIQHFLNAIIDELAEGNRLEFREFGVFESRERAAGWRRTHARWRRSRCRRSASSSSRSVA